MPGLGGRGAAGAGATSADLEAAAALDFGAAALRGVGFAFLAADFFGALFLAAECFFFRDRATLFAFFVFLVFDFVFFAMIVLPIARHYSELSPFSEALPGSGFFGSKITAIGGALPCDKLGIVMGGSFSRGATFSQPWGVWFINPSFTLSPGTSRAFDRKVRQSVWLGSVRRASPRVLAIQPKHRAESLSLKRGSLQWPTP
jgi:hypothetical protein